MPMIGHPDREPSPVTVGWRSDIWHTGTCKCRKTWSTLNLVGTFGDNPVSIVSFGRWRNVITSRRLGYPTTARERLVDTMGARSCMKSQRKPVNFVLSLGTYFTQSPAGMRTSSPLAPHLREAPHTTLTAGHTPRLAGVVNQTTLPAQSHYAALFPAAGQNVNSHLH